MKIVINSCYGGFGLSDAAYEWLISKGIPVRSYVKEKRGPDGLYKKEPANEGRVIFDRDLHEPDPKDPLDSEEMRRFFGRYWETWLRDDESRSDPLLVECVETLGERANGPHAELVVVEIPDGVEWEIDEYDGMERVAEKHRTWG